MELAKNIFSLLSIRTQRTMKSIFFSIVSLTIIFPLVTHARPSTNLSLQEVIQRSIVLETCAEGLRDELRPVVQDVGGWVLDIFGRMGRIIELRQTCDRIHMSDPPTRWEILQREACEARFQTQIIFEVARLTYEVNQMLQTHPATIRESVQRFQECVSNEIPDFEMTPFHQSLHRN